MSTSSRTPEGTPNHCPVCNSDIRIEPSVPSGDAPCPNCGTLLWFIQVPSGIRYYKSESVAPIRQRVQQIVSEKLSLNEKTNSSSFFLGDLQADSLDIVELVMALEEQFNVSISEDDLRQVKTVGDVVDYIMQNSL